MSGVWRAGFGAFITWFLLGGDLYTAYTFIAVPALVFASGSIGFYAVAYTIMAPDHVHLPAQAVVGLPGARLRDPGRLHRGRYGSRGLALAWPSPGSWR